MVEFIVYLKGRDYSRNIGKLKGGKNHRELCQVFDAMCFTRILQNVPTFWSESFTISFLLLRLRSLYFIKSFGDPILIT